MSERVSPPDGQDSAFPPQMVKIQVPDGFDLDSLPHFPPKWSRFGSNLLKLPASIFEADGTTCYRRIELPWAGPNRPMQWRQRRKVGEGEMGATG